MGRLLDLHSRGVRGRLPSVGAGGPGELGTPTGPALSCSGDELQGAGLLGSVVESAGETLALGAQRAQPVAVLHDRVHGGPLRAGRVALRLAAQEQLGDAVLGRTSKGALACRPTRESRWLRGGVSFPRKAQVR